MFSGKHATQLTIGDVVKATGVGEATLRAWERRFGWPVPQRQPSGHRRYTREDVERILRVLEQRRVGIPLAAAIERTRAASTGVPSLFALLRGSERNVSPMMMPKRHLMRLTHAIEDESASRAERAFLIGSFQRERFYRASEARWHELAQGADLAFVFADFQRLRPRTRPVEIPLDRSHPLSREWALICEAPAHCVCMIGWEPPGRRPARDGGREFEVLLSFEPATVRAAVEAAVAISGLRAPEVAEVARRRLEEVSTPRPESQLRLAAAITARVVATLH
jgi:DNA-binding transcriptional MerR regulator